MTERIWVGGKIKNKAKKFTKPTSLTPRKKKTGSPHPRTDTVRALEAVWCGREGDIDILGMKFCVSSNNLSSGKTECRISLVSAPVGTKLAGLNHGTYVTLASVHSGNFFSRFKKGSSGYQAQKQMWVFFSDIFVSLGVRVVERKKQPPPVVVKKKESKPRPFSEVSHSVESFVSKTPGLYSFGGALFRVMNDPRPSQSVNRQTRLVVEFVSSHDGHELRKIVGRGTYIPFQAIFRASIIFRGVRAAEHVKLWEYLRNVLSEYRKELHKKISEPAKESQGLKIGAPVVLSSQLHTLRI